MNVTIASDLEGVTGVNDVRQIVGDPGGEFFDRARLELTEDVNAAIRGLKRGGAMYIRIIDGHNRGSPPNIIDVEIEGGAQVVRERMPYKSLGRSCDALVLVGYHAMAGTLDGFMSHTMTSITAVRINGRYVGETAIVAGIAGHYEVPTIMVTGDTALVREARAFLPGIEGVAVKMAKRRDSVERLPRDEASRLIEEAATRAMQKIERCKPYKVSRPVHLEVIFATAKQADLACTLPKSKRGDERTISYLADDFLEVVLAFEVARQLAWPLVERPFLERMYRLEEVAEMRREWQYERLGRWISEPPPFETGD